MKKFAVALLLVCIAPVVQAQEFRFGLQGGLSLPLGDAGNKDYLNNRFAFAFGMHGVWNFHPGHRLVPRIDIVNYQRNKDGNDFITSHFKSSVTLKDIKVGVDYNITTKINNLYGIAGLGYSSHEWAIFNDPVLLARETKSTIYFSLGAGYPMTDNLLAEFRYTHANYSDVGSSIRRGISLTAPAMTLSLLWRY